MDNIFNAFGQDQKIIIGISVEKYFAPSQIVTEIITKTKIHACQKCMKNYANQNSLKKHKIKHLLKLLIKFYKKKQRQEIQE